MMTPYEVLGIPQDASLADIKSAYRRKSKIFHPDVSGSQDNVFFLGIKEAYDLMRDPVRRKRYDETGKTTPSRVTPENIRVFIDSLMNSVVHSVTEGKIVDDPTIEDIRQKCIRSIKTNQGNVKRNILDLSIKLDRIDQLITRFILREEIQDVVGQSLQAQESKIRDELARAEDALELSEEAIKVLNSYDYKVDPGQEGQYYPRSTIHPGGGSSTSSA